ncbi:MAG: site-specific DNA-methyltransferase [Rhodoferax sp.]
MTSITLPQELSFKVVCGDARKVLKKIPSGTINAVVTSPPYWGLRTYGHDDELGKEETFDEYLTSLLDVFREVWRVLDDGGVMWLVLGDSYTSGNRRYRAADKKFPARGMTYRPRTPLGLKQKELIGLPWRVAFALQAQGWFLRTDVVWAKPNPMPEVVKDRPHRSHEFIFMLTKSPNYFFDTEAFKHPTVGGGQFSRSVWSIPVGQRQTGHPAAFPLDLVVPCIVSSTKPLGLVLDPFTGSSSVGLACLRIGRRFLGIEVVPEFALASRKSLRKLQKQNELANFSRTRSSAASLRKATQFDMPEKTA